MDEFKIIEEATLSFIEGDKLYLMLIKDNGNYFIEVDSKTSCIGKRQVRSRKEGEVVFEQMEKRLCCYFDVWSAFEMLDFAFAMETIREHMFLVNNLNREVSFNEIWKFKRQYMCQTTPVITDLIYEDCSYNKTIYITFPGRKEPLGYFKAPDEDSNFTFHLGDSYRFRI
jgi:hypothetical protein